MLKSYKNQSIDHSNPTMSAGTPMVFKTIKSITKPELGIAAAPMLVKVAVTL